MTGQLKSIRKDPYTLGSFFDAVEEEVKIGSEPGIDYALGSRDDFQLTTDDFEDVASVGYGGSEGIYTDIFIQGYFDGNREQKPIGTIKTLNEDPEWMEKMGALGGRFVAAATDFIRKNSFNFIFKGYYIKRANYGLYVFSEEEFQKELKKGFEHAYDLTKREEVSL